MVLLGADDLVILVTLAGKQNNILRLGQHHRSLYRFASVGDFQIPVARLDSRLHLAQNLFGILGARVVRGKNRNIRHLRSHATHNGAFGFISIATAAADNYQSLTALAQFVNGLYDIFEGIGCMGKIDHRRSAVLCHHRLETTTHRAQHTQMRQHILLVKAEQSCCAIDRQEVVGIKATEELHPHLTVVDTQLHTLRHHLDNFGTEVGHSLQRECMA